MFAKAYFIECNIKYQTDTNVCKRMKTKILMLEALSVNRHNMLRKHAVDISGLVNDTICNMQIKLGRCYSNGAKCKHTIKPHSQHWELISLGCDVVLD